MLKPLKSTLNAAAAALVLPAVLACRLTAALTTPARAFPGWSQLFSLVPGMTGLLLRRAFYRLTLKRCEPTTTIGFGTLLSNPSTSLGSYVDIGNACVLGSVTIEDDCLIASRVSIINGLEQHGIDRLDIPVREQPGRFLPITIGRDTWIGEGAVIAANIGSQCIVGAGAVVTRPLPDYAIAAGVPARIIRFREQQEPVEQRNSGSPPSEGGAGGVALDTKDIPFDPDSQKPHSRAAPAPTGRTA